MRRPPERAGHGAPLPLLLALGIALLAGCAGRDRAPALQQPTIAVQPADCRALAASTLPDARLTRVEPVPAGPLTPTGSPVPIALPAHCLVQGAIAPRTGVDGRAYETRFELRLPLDWNGRFVYQGGGGNDGVVFEAVGRNTGSSRFTGSALGRNFAVVSTDAGHQGPGPEFGLDPEARIDNAWRAHERTANTARLLIRRLYGIAPRQSYFVGCSGGGRQGMMFTQRFPALFDGVVVTAPAMSVSSRATIAAAWDTQRFLAIAPTDESGQRILSRAFSPADLDLVARGVNAACDARDGLADGMVNDTRNCRFDPGSLQCPGAKTAACLAPPQVDALRQAFAGPRNSAGEPLYLGQPWDPGIAAPGWRAWKLGSSQTAAADANNVRLMAGALAFYFVTPPDPQLRIERFDFDQDPARMLGHSLVFDTFRDDRLDAFRKRGGKLLMFHGMADGIFSAEESIDYYERLARSHGGVALAGRFARLFLVPGMNHCMGGPATDAFDGLAAIVDWVEAGVVPDRIEASAPVDSAWFPKRRRPLCPYPRIARFAGRDPEDSASFSCELPVSRP